MVRRTALTKRPTTVYLDTSDISNLSTPGFAARKTGLLELKERGLARFPFSDVLLLESLPVDEDAAGKGIARIRTIAELSGLEHHPSAWAILDHEVRRIVARHRKSRVRAPMPTDWFYQLGEIPDLWGDVRKSLMEEWKATPGSSRTERRYRMKKLAQTFRASAATPAEEERLAVLIDSYPFREKDRLRLLSALKTSTTSADINLLHREALGDIVNFAEWVVRSGERGQGVVRGLRAQGMAIESVLVEYAHRTRQAHEGMQGAASKSERLAGLRLALAGMRSEWLTEVPRLMAARLFRKDASDFNTLPPLTPDTTPSLYALHEFMMQVIDKSSSESMPRNPVGRASHDYLDALHAVFLPHVDVFRSDRFASGLLVTSPLSAATAIAPSLADVPALVMAHQSRA
ncbi:hypothetical protein [Luteibacter aegosomatissinici]|uniref:hypothetical protein n=1 Tax=Luteibacter aegosomatissinici TaxID=2911539 RepID=UPI001FF96E6F|nr:hypothetical protein [Luteibacter aegosomatissinici]UPG92705.1 hypothetical protein L2Y97_12600 [Luteibacter aegosomatissinici]